jgi:LCP family protein required for cell wall assembly
MAGPDGWYARCSILIGMVGGRAWRCARCQTLNLGGAEACRRCGAAFGAAAPFVDRRRARARDHAGLAAALSLFLPGLGQLYTGRFRRAFVIFAAPVAVAIFAFLVLSVASPLVALLLRVAVGLAAAAVVLLAAYHAAVLLDAFGAPSTRGHALAGKRPAEYAMLVASFALLAVLYVTLFRQATAWASLTARVFEPFQQSGGLTAASWGGSDRFNLLLMGIDTRKGHEGETQNTDTLIVLTVDPLNHAAGMLSIPRDTLVSIPGQGEDKINAAFALGGADLARKTVSQFLGIPIHSYALVDFVGFRRIIDAVDGIGIDAPLPVRDEDYPTEDFGVTRLDLRAGPQVLAGEPALRYSRSRHDSNDFSRAERQQRVLSALKARIVDRSALLQLPSLVDELSGAVRTDMDPTNALPLARLGLGIDSKDIERAVLKPSANGEAGQLRETNAGGYFLIPIRPAVDALVAEVFYDPRVRAESARVEIRAPAAKATIADELRGDLERRHYAVGAVMTAQAQARTTVILRNPDKRYTAEQLAHTLGATVVSQSGSASDADVVAVLGDDFRGVATSP